MGALEDFRKAKAEGKDIYAFVESKRMAKRDGAGLLSMIAGLNDGQRDAFDTVMDGHNTFITGAGGVGKSYLLKAIIEQFQYDGKRVITLAPTGIACENLRGTTNARTALDQERVYARKTYISADTIHSFFRNGTGIWMRGEGKKRKFIDNGRKLAGCKFKGIDVIIIDEISMVRADVFDSICTSVLSAAKKGHKTQLVVVGDFYQLPPVVTDEVRAILEDSYEYDGKDWFSFDGKHWDDMEFQMCELTDVVRQKDATYIKILNDLRCGVFNVWDTNLLFSSIEKKMNDYIWIYPTKKKVREMNIKKLSELPGDTSVSRFEVEKGLYTEALMDEDDKEIFLKRGAKVMFTVNQSWQKDDWFEVYGADCDHTWRGFYNGMTGIINCIYREDKKDEICVWITPTDHPNVSVLLKKKLFYITETDPKNLNQHNIGSYWQLPLRLAYAITIHKAQGSTYKQGVVIDPNCGWAPGLLYVALSRATDLSHVCLTEWVREDYFKANPRVTEFYKKMREK